MRGPTQSESYKAALPPLDQLPVFQYGLPSIGSSGNNSATSNAPPSSHLSGNIAPPAPSTHSLPHPHTHHPHALPGPGPSHPPHLSPYHPHALPLPNQYPHAQMQQQPYQQQGPSPLPHPYQQQQQQPSYPPPQSSLGHLSHAALLGPLPYQMTHHPSPYLHQQYVESLIKAGKLPLLDPNDLHSEQMKWVYSAFQNQAKKKKRNRQACTNCKKAKLRCSETRPCNRCICTGKAHSCLDIPDKRRKIQKHAMPSSPNSHSHGNGVSCDGEHRLSMEIPLRMIEHGHHIDNEQTVPSSNISPVSFHDLLNDAKPSPPVSPHVKFDRVNIQLPKLEIDQNQQFQAAQSLSSFTSSSSSSSSALRNPSFLPPPGTHSQAHSHMQFFADSRPGSHKLDFPQPLSGINNHPSGPGSSYGSSYSSSPLMSPYEQNKHNNNSNNNNNINNNNNANYNNGQPSYPPPSVDERAPLFAPYNTSPFATHSAGSSFFSSQQQQQQQQQQQHMHLSQMQQQQYHQQQMTTTTTATRQPGTPGSLASSSSSCSSSSSSPSSQSGGSNSGSSTADY